MPDGRTLRTYWRRCRETLTFRPRLSYAYAGEDVMVAHLFGWGALPRRGFYVDIGASFPVVHSNTYFFYRRGWHGICVDARPGLNWRFRLLRPRDVFVQCAITTCTGPVSFFVNDRDPYQSSLTRRDPSNRHISVPTCTLAHLLASHGPADHRIDMLSVDAEGTDLEVLCSNDWTRWRPTLVLAEALDAEHERGLRTFLGGVGYQWVATNGLTHVFRMG